jgi:hypothetical protein
MFETKNQNLKKDPLISQIETINPYYRAVMMVLERLTYDLHPYSYSSRKKLRKIKNSYLGKKAVILCNGPSLLETDFDLLKDVYTFGLNKINLLFDKTDFRPSSIVAVNPYVIVQNSKFYNLTECPLFLDYKAARKYIKNRNNVTFVHSTRINRFARDCSMSLHQGSTVTFIALQLAFHMGFKKIALVGCDHCYSDSGNPNMLVKAKSKDINHFDENYFSENQLWQYPDIEKSEESYRLARHVYTVFGREIVNATVGGKLELFKRQPLSSFLVENN